MMLSIFDNSNSVRNAFRQQGIAAHSLDINNNYKTKDVDFVCNILDFEYQAYSPGHYKFLFIALPCQCYSIASGSFHFKNGIPVTSSAHNAINILIKIWQITQYFNCEFIIENPSGGLINNSFFKAFFNLQVNRITLKSFGFVTQKKTDLFSSFPFLFMYSPVVRVNGKYQSRSLDNLTYRQRVLYPDHFVSELVRNIVIQCKKFSNTQIT